MKFNTRKMDMDALDELIAQCEDSMVQPFSKKAKGGLAIEVDGAAGDGEPDRDDGEGDSGHLDLSDIDLQDLLEAYRDSHGGGEG